MCDNGGWTDTWFAGRGTIFNIGVYPYAEVQVQVFEEGEPGIVLHAENYGERYAVTPPPSPWGPHPLLEAAIAYMKVPEQLRLEVTIHSEAPTGAGTGTSAAVTVALVGALDALTPGRLTAHEVAYAAQAVETEMLHRQCGIQDQLASAYGGISYIEMFDYPRATVSPIRLPDALWWELERRLVLVYLGRSHDSSAIHEQVIRELENAGPDCPPLEDLRQDRAPLPRRALRRGLRGPGPGHDREHRRPGPPQPGPRRHRGLTGDRDRPRARRARLEGQRRRRRGRLDHAPVRRALAAQARASSGPSSPRIPDYRHIPTYLSRSGLRVWIAGPEAGARE